MKVKKVKEGCSECNGTDKDKEVKEKLNRAAKVASIFKDIHYKTETDKAEAILSFVNANLSLEEIENLAKPLRSDYMQGQVYRKGVY